MKYNIHLNTGDIVQAQGYKSISFGKIMGDPDTHIIYHTELDKTTDEVFEDKAISMGLVSIGAIVFIEINRINH